MTRAGKTKSAKPTKRKSVFAATVAMALGSTSALAMEAHGAVHKRQAVPRGTVVAYIDGKRQVIDVEAGHDYVSWNKPEEGHALVQADYAKVEERIAHTMGVPDELVTATAAHDMMPGGERYNQFMGGVGDEEWD